jgi:hypothetical protein
MPGEELSYPVPGVTNTGTWTSKLGGSSMELDPR